ncbi:hypothetical protein K2X85_12245 [bacterium]|nr:hypothetical protein [bacterium]
MIDVLVSTILLLLAGENATGPKIEKEGTIECDIVEATPVVFNDRLLFFQSVRPDYKHKAAGVEECYFRFWDEAEHRPMAPFGLGYHLGSATVIGDYMYVFGVKAWGASRIDMFWTNDLEDWKSMPALDLPGWSIFNNSVCRADGRYVMAFEIDKPTEEAGVPFTTRFAESTDLRSWKLLPSDCVHSKDRYAACPTLRYIDGWFYMTYLEAKPGPEYETSIVRSRDLRAWESSKTGPVLTHTGDDQKIASDKLTLPEQTRIREAKNINNSDFDFCTWKGETIILYSWGNQQGVEHLARARYPGSAEDFLRSFFPK